MPGQLPLDRRYSDQIPYLLRRIQERLRVLEAGGGGALPTMQVYGAAGLTAIGATAVTVALDNISVNTDGTIFSFAGSVIEAAGVTGRAYLNADVALGVNAGGGDWECEVTLEHDNGDTGGWQTVPGSTRYLSG